MSFLIPMLGQGLGAILGAKGNSGKQGQQNNTSTNTQTQHETTSNQFQQGQQGQQQQNAMGYSAPVEDPYTQMFRNKLMGNYQDTLQNANTPVYGDAQKAGFLSDLNGLAQGSIHSLKSQLGASGGLDSGALNLGLGDIGRQRDSQAAGFFSQIPFLNDQAKFQKTATLMGLGNQLASLAPHGTFNLGNTSGASSSQAQGSSEGQRDVNGQSISNSQSTQFGPSFGSGLLQSLGNMAAGGSMNSLFGKLFGGGGGGGGGWDFGG